MRNATRISLAAVLFSAGFLVSTPAQTATIVGMSHMEGNGHFQRVDYRSHKRFHERRFYRRHHHGYPYRLAYRHHYRHYDDYYSRPVVRFGLEVKKHHYHRYGY